MTKILLFPIILLITIVQNSYDLISILQGGDLALHTYSGPIYIKLLKDVLFFSIIFMVIISSTIKGESFLKETLVFIFLLILILFFLSMYFNGVYIALLGVRWFIPLFIFLIMGNWVANLDNKKLIFWIYIGLYICLLVQVIQLFIMPPIYGVIFANIPARTPGIFMAPNSAAFFGCASAALIISASEGRFKESLYPSFLSLLISLLAQSGTGIIVSFLLIMTILTERNTIVRFVILPIVLIVAFLSLNIITQRDNYLELSGGGRIDILISIFEKSIYQYYSVNGFGVFTNAANLSSENPEEMVAPDSLIASMIGNLGLFFIPIVVLLVLFYRNYINKHNINSSSYIPVLLVFILFSFTTIIFEAFPMNLYLAIALLLTNKSTKNFAGITK
ncbi:hypothetical protein [Pseudoalteromonas sp. ND6B]|uniref:hypothetical protein n=1 Tax=Pseudoalteromonas sp. ND6B TaxID=1535421 RepID=UPI00051A4A64|nr:hypothetical protein [Pseudoalteromonas sp. ND6B]KGJ99254.1 hypothetical protein ND6B_2917 [Pseudoalteromonas sp. ND6B]